MWETPIYLFKTKIDNKDTELKIDVTGSAPNFSEPGKQLEATFSQLLSGLKPNDTHILDFGAAKLRNTLYLLRKGYHVYACEYNDLFQRSKQAKDFKDEAEKYNNFHKLIFPRDFIKTDVKFDVILMINVLNIMPIASERLLVLELCRNRIKENGKFLWYTQHGAYDYDKAVCRLNDGIATGKGREFKMFYRDFSRKEIHELLNSSGFKYNDQYKFSSSSSNQAYLFDASGAILITETLKAIKSENKKYKKDLKEIVRKSYKTKFNYKTKEPIKPKLKKEVQSINILETYIDELSNIKPGKKDAKKYENIIFRIIKILFEPNLKNGAIQVPVDNKLGFIDIMFDNKAKSGFFSDIKANHQIKSPYVYFECKNYSDDPKNPEMNQLSSRLSDTKGMFGIMVCRYIENDSCLMQDVRKN